MSSLAYSMREVMKGDDETGTDEAIEKNRSIDDIIRMEQEFFDKIWFDRHLTLKYRVEQGIESVDPKIWKDAIAAAETIIEKYGEDNLGPYSDFEWGMLNGKMSALRWVLGDEWDMLDT